MKTENIHINEWDKAKIWVLFRGMKNKYKVMYEPLICSPMYVSSIDLTTSNILISEARFHALCAI